ncbi:hypothetical protein bcere0026_53170 [Bacillus mycoides]|uniref:Uncharacterized protein n=1 Tax=Bacillus mycoides TaxID=1405 RepID=C2Y2X0_BACMY|nr:hypothetical protein bcere0026_53170 [Bacillus mycoides]
MNNLRKITAVDGDLLFEAIKKLNGEGIVAKQGGVQNYKLDCD